MDNQVSTLALVLIAAVGGIGALLGALFSTLGNVWLERGKRREAHNMWVREQQFTAYNGLMLATTHLYLAAGLHGDKDPRPQVLTDAHIEFQDASESALLITPEPTVQVLRELTRSFSSTSRAKTFDGMKAAELASQLRRLLRPMLVQYKYTPTATKPD